MESVGRRSLSKKPKVRILYDVDGKRYVDYVGSRGPMILGHAHPAIIKAVQDAAVDGLSFGAPTVHETTLCRYYLRDHAID